jgi:hypothetical protein
MIAEPEINLLCVNFDGPGATPPRLRG